MGGELSTEQLLLLNNLMYLPNDKPFTSIENMPAGSTVKDWMEGIEKKIESGTPIPDMEGGLTTGKEWRDILNAVKADPELCKIEIVSTYVDKPPKGGGGTSAVFKNPDTGEGVVTFCGTASEEWKDNFAGGGPTNTKDGVSTPYEQNALEWYQGLDKSEFSSVTVTGHSKGGHKSKYITIMDDSVDRCVSFDGQGFSDEFVDKYQGEIAQNQGKIDNHNASGDYVNILLNDVGETHYYEANNIGDGGFIENHCANTPLNIAEDGSVTMRETGQDPSMQELDKFFNSILRSFPPEQSEKKAALLALLGEIAQMGMGRKGNEPFDTQELVQLLSDNPDSAAYVIAYLIEYEQANPEFEGAIRDLLQDIGMQDILPIIDFVNDGLVLNGPFGITFTIDFDTIADIADGVADTWVMNALLRYLADKYGITLTEDQARQLLSIVSKANGYMDQIEICKEVDDRKVSSIKSNTGARATGTFKILLGDTMMCAGEFNSCSTELRSCAAQVESICNSLNGLGGGTNNIRNVLRKAAGKISDEQKAARNMGRKLEEIVRTYEMAEQKVCEYNGRRHA